MENGKGAKKALNGSSVGKENKISVAGEKGSPEMAGLNIIISDAVGSNPTTTLTTIQNNKIKKHQRLQTTLTKLKSLTRKNKILALDQLISEIEKYTSKITPRLDNYIITVQPLLNELYKKISTKEKIEAIIGIEFPISGKNNNKVFQAVRDAYLEKRSEELVYRLLEELNEKCFPIFWTLTTDAKNEKLIKKGSQAFKNWLRPIRKQFGPFKYCCVTERGEYGRLHYHSIFTFEELRFSDPNINKPGNNCLPAELRGQWPYGTSDPIAIRYNPTDQYGQAGWRWPINQPTGSREAVSIYQAKYLRKSTEETNQCRTKITQKFGLRKLYQMTHLQAALCQNLNPNQIQNLLKLKSPPPQRLTDYVTGRILFETHIPQSLPITKAGCVREASVEVATQIYNRMNAGDYLSKSDGFKGQLNQWKKNHQSLRMGLII